MSKNKKNKQKRAARFKKLLAANVSVNKARNVCNLPWEDICKIIPGLESTVPVKPTIRARLGQEAQHTECFSRQETDPTSFSHNPCDAHQTPQESNNNPNHWGPVQHNEPGHYPNEYDTNQGSLLLQPYRSPQNYTIGVECNYREETVPLQTRSFESSLKKRRLSEAEPNWEPPFKIPKALQVDFGESHYQGRDGILGSAKTKARYDSIPMECISDDNAQLNNIDPDEILQIKVRKGIRAVKRHYNEGNDEIVFSDHKAEKTSLEDGVSVTSLFERDHPSRLGLRNKTHSLQTLTSTYSYSEDKKFREDPRNYRKIAWESVNSVNLDCSESDRPSRDGLRNETHPMACIDFSDEEYSCPIFRPYTPVDEGDATFELSDSFSMKSKLATIGSLRNQSSKSRKTFKGKDAKDADPIRVSIRNIHPMTPIQMSLVHQSINQAIVQIGVQGAGPKFSGITFKSGWILMICENHESRKWLEMKVPALKPWSGAQLSISLLGEVLEPIKLTLLIPYEENVTVETALTLLGVQNPGLKTDQWKVMKVWKIYAGQIVILSVDKDSFEALKLVNFKANLGTDKVSFRVKSKSKLQRRLVMQSENVALPSFLCVEGQNHDVNSGVVQSKRSKKRQRQRLAKKAKLAISQTIDEPSQKAQVKEAKSRSSKIWQTGDQSFSKDDWINW